MSNPIDKTSQIIPSQVSKRYLSKTFYIKETSQVKKQVIRKLFENTSSSYESNI